MADVAVRARGLSKCYSVYDNQRARLMHALWPGHASGRQDIWALRDVDLSVDRGEAVAVIGRNGGGKTTLLEIIAGTLKPTRGEIAVEGRVSALLELGSGFNPEYTGRDNVLMNGLVLGISREEILRRFDEVLAFSEIGDAIDRPVKTYSSGMVMRLAFAVQVLADPEVLIVDEALSVGDFFFQQKCFRRIRELRDRGVTLLFVSHDMRTVRDLCSRALYLRRGQVEFDGDSVAAIRHYLAEKPANGATGEHSAAPMYGGTTELALPDEPFWRRAEAATPGPLLAVELLDAQGKPTTRARIGDTVRLRVYFRAPSGGPPGHVSIALRNRYEQVVTNTGSYACGMPAMSSGESPFAVFQAEVDVMLEAGLYSLMVAFGHPTGRNHGKVVDDTGWIGPLQVDWDYENEIAPFWGMFGLPMRGELLGAHADE